MCEARLSYIQSLLQMFFNDYSEFLEGGHQGGEFYMPRRNCTLPEPVFLQPIRIDQDEGFSEFTSVISKHLQVKPYPSSFLNTNPLCPLCLRLVDNTLPFANCSIAHARNYLIHQECLARDKAYPLRSVGQVLENEMKAQGWPAEREEPVEEKSHELDTRQFYVETVLSHPINDKNFIRLAKKVPLVGGKLTMRVKEEEEEGCLPNIVLLAATDYHLTITLSQVGNTANTFKFTKYISFKQLQSKTMLKGEQVTLKVEFVDLQEKKRLVDLMNYKCKMTTDALSFVRLHSLSINLPEEFEEAPSIMFDSGSTIVEDLLNDKVESLVKTWQGSPFKSGLMTDSTSSNETEQERVDLARMIANGSLVEFVKSSNHSRILQNYLGQCSREEVAAVVEQVSNSLPELVVHQYGNYMLQKLFAVSQPMQRLHLLQLLLGQVCELVRNKQGTHTLQAYLDHCALPEEFSLLSMQLAAQFHALCCHNNATHFIQKLLKTFPLEYTIGYFHYISTNLMAFALDKNAMCVVKQMMRRVRELQEKEGPYGQALQIVRRQLIINATLNVDSLVVDSFGNYVIQFCYQLFQEEECSGITERIFFSFSQYAIGKFASSVLLKCITTYWGNHYLQAAVLALSQWQILELFRNKDGNKILVEAMERLEGSQAWGHLYSILVQAEPTKFYHDRWSVCLGSRSGQVGTRLTAFPEARRKQNRRH